MQNIHFGKAILCLWIGIVCLTGCAVQSEEARQQANQLWEHPEPRPDYIWDIRFGTNECIDIFLGFFKDLPYAPPDMNLKDLVDKVAFTVDGRLIDAETLANDRYVFTACFSLRFLIQGVHIASLTLTNFSGVKTSYAWAFDINTDGSVSLPPLVLTPSPTKLSE